MTPGNGRLTGARILFLPLELHELLSLLLSVFFRLLSHKIDFLKFSTKGPNMVNPEWQPQFLSLDFLSSRSQKRPNKRIVVFQFQVSTMENMNSSPWIRCLPLLHLIVA